MNKLTVAQAADFLRAGDRFVILTHKRPDGDTVGCAAALCEGLRALGRTAWICPHTEETHLFTPYLEGRLAPEGYVPETVVSVDIAATQLLPENAKMFAEIKLEPGCSLGTHTHTGEYEVFFFHEGEVTLNDNGTERKMHPGDFAICYDGESHGIANRTDKPASLFAAIIKTK